MRRVLFVDDEVRILDGLKRMLRVQRLDWEMAFASSGNEALAFMESSSFDVVVSDMRMPGMDGASLLTKVCELYPQMVRIVLSGHTELTTALRVVPVAHQFLAKPCDADMLRVAVERACHLQDLLSDDSICRTVGALRELPSLPRTYHALTQALTQPGTSLQQLARIVEQDVGISAKILQLVNSAFFGMARAVTNIEHAVVYLGINTLKNLVLSLEIFSVFEPKTELPGFSFEGLQAHARLAAHIATRLPVPKHLADMAVATGMLHDVGKLILACKLPHRTKGQLATATEEHCPLHVVEEREYGFSHAEIGAYLLGLWGLPNLLVEAVALHHHPNRVPRQGFDLVSAVYAANLLAHELESPAPGVPLEEEAGGSDGPLGAVGSKEEIASWRAMAAEMPARLAEA